MSIHTRVSGSWREILSVHVHVGDVWKQCKNVYVKTNGAWKPLLSHQESVGIPGIFNTRKLSNVQIGSTITITGEATNNTFDQGDYYAFEISGASLLSGSLRVGPYPGSYTITLKATANEVSIYLTGNGMSTISGTITYYSTL